MQPSRVAELLLEQGRNSADLARAQGQVWGGLAERLGQVPNEFLKQRRDQQQQDIENQARKARLDLDTTHLQMLQGDRATKSAEQQRTLEGQALTSQLVKQHSTQNPETGDWEIDHPAVINGLMQGGHPEAAGHYADLGDKIENMYADTQKKHLEFEAKKRQGYADILGSVANAPEAERESRYAIMRGALAPHTATDPVLGRLPATYPGHEAFKELYDATLTDAQRWDRQKEAAAARLKGTHEVPPGGKLVQIDDTTGAVKTLAEGGPPAGEAEAKVRDAETVRHHKATEAITKTKGASDKLVRVEHMGDDGRTVIEWLPQSELRGQTFKKGVGGTTESRLASAQAVNQTGEDMIQKLSNPAYAAKVGPAMGRFNTLREFIGNPPPEFAELAGSIESYSLANMGVHGMRSAQGAEQIKKLLDQKHTPASLVATIQGLNAFSTHFMQNEGRVTTPANSGASRVYYDANGNPIKR